MCKKIEIDFSPEAAAFYAKHSLQEDNVFIEHVIHTGENVRQSEDDIIARIDGDDVTQDKLALIREQSNKQLLNELLDTLTKKERTVVTMRMMGCTYEEIGRAIGHVQSWTHTIYGRAIQKMKKNAEEILNG